MHVVVELASTVNATVSEPNAFGRFDVVVRGSDDLRHLADAVESLGIGRLVGKDVMVRCEWLRSNADDGTPNWAAGFAGMVGFAESHGWLSSDGRSIKAHVVWASESTKSTSLRSGSRTDRGTSPRSDHSGSDKAGPGKTDPTGTASVR